MIVYWIHNPDQTDPKREGYIGVTNNAERRLKEHSNRMDNPALRNAIKAGAIMTVLFEGVSEEQAYSIEEEYRPKENIGWNIIVGGTKPPSLLGVKHRETKLNLEGEERTEAQKKASAKRKGKALSSSHKDALRKPKANTMNMNKTKHVCPHCGKSGQGGGMKRWHFNNCKEAGG